MGLQVLRLSRQTRQMKLVLFGDKRRGCFLRFPLSPASPSSRLKVFLTEIKGMKGIQKPRPGTKKAPNYRRLRVAGGGFDACGWPRLLSLRGLH